MHFTYNFIQFAGGKGVIFAPFTFIHQYFTRIQLMKNFAVAFGIVLFCLAQFACKRDATAVANDQRAKAVADSLAAFGELPNTWKDVPCTLITDEEVAAVYGNRFTTNNYRVNTLPEGNMCMRQWDHPDFAARKVAYEQGGSTLSPRSTLVVNFVHYGNRDAARRMMEKMLEEDPKGWNMRVPEAGDGGMWSDDTGSLRFRRGAYLFTVTTDVEPDMHANLEIAKQVAAVMVKKIDAQLEKDK